MNKQELNEKVKSLVSFNSPHGKDFEWGFDDCRHRVLSLIPALDEPQKVKVPAFVAEWIERNKSGDVQLIIILKYFGQWYEMNENENLNDEICEWVIENSETFVRAWLDGYEVEEEPKWIVRVGEKLLFKEYDDNEFPVFVIDDNPGATEQAEIFYLEEKATNVQNEVGGTVEKV